MPRFILLIALTLLLSIQVLPAQVDCIPDYDSVYDLQDSSHHIFNADSISLRKKIKLSKKYANEALENGYKAIESKGCKQYSIIVDRMIELEFQLGRFENAQHLALNRLDELYPGWKEYNNYFEMDPENFIALAYSFPKKKGSSFYWGIRKYKQVSGSCGNDEGIYDVYRRSQTLLEKYGNIYCFRYLQNSKLNINVTDQREFEMWTLVYDQLLNSWASYCPISKLLADYEDQPVLENNTDEYLNLYYGKDYINLNSTKLFFAPKYSYNHSKGEYTYPDAEKVKLKCLFYQRLKLLATNEKK